MRWNHNLDTLEVTNVYASNGGADNSGLYMHLEHWGTHSMKQPLCVYPTAGGDPSRILSYVRTGKLPRNKLGCANSTADSEHDIPFR